MGVALPTNEELIVEFQALDLECERLNRRIELAVLRKRFSQDHEEAGRAAEEEQSWLCVLDQTMTRLRAVESRLTMLLGPAARRLDETVH